ncbi:YgjP-like metallopeptidase domain-containing protein [Candidatus Margulisiibacteriota bacterium]
MSPYEPNHSKKFWRLVEERMVDYKIWRQKLRI